ncbi:MAG: Cys-tRNA(Pro) deacylase [Treponema sp.]|nr:Cys-tRNA(Pro) deacylase [Treponema sp.]
MKKTNAMRILDSNKIKYETLSYDDDGEHELSRGAAENVAAKLGINPTACFKTIVMRTESKQLVVFCQSATHEINLKKARQACGAKEVTPVKPDELLSLTGYIRGGCSPIGMKKLFPTFIDQSALSFEKIYISAGIRGEQIVLDPNDLVKVTKATATDLVLEENKA